MTILDYAELAAPVTHQDIDQYSEFPDSPTGEYSAVSLLKHGALGSAISLALVVFFALLFLVSTRESPVSDGGRVVVITAATGCIASWVGAVWFTLRIRRKWKQYVRLSRFTEANGLTLHIDSGVPFFSGSIFQQGDSHHAPVRISRDTAPLFDFGNLVYTIDVAKGKIFRRWSYLAIKLDRNLPRMVLDAKANNRFRSNLPDKLFRDQILPLEGNFDKHFTLYCPKEYERDALYVFTPDLMAMLLEGATFVDVEVADDWIFFYSNGHLNFTKPATYPWALWIVDNIGSKTIRGTGRYADDRVKKRRKKRKSATAADVNTQSPLTSRMAHNTVAPKGRSLRKWPSGILIAAWEYFLIITPVVLIVTGIVLGIMSY